MHVRVCVCGREKCEEEEEKREVSDALVVTAAAKNEAKKGGKKRKKANASGANTKVAAQCVLFPSSFSTVSHPPRHPAAAHSTFYSRSLSLCVVCVCVCVNNRRRTGDCRSVQSSSRASRISKCWAPRSTSL